MVAEARELMRRLQEASLPLVLTKKEAARQLGVKRTSLDALIASGQIKVLRYAEDGHPRITSAEVLRFIAERSENSAPPGRRAAPLPTKRVPIRRARQQGAKAESAKLRAALRRR